MKDFLKKSGWTDILVSLVFAVIAIFMITKSDAVVKIISYVLGGIFIVMGAVKIIDYFASKGKYDLYNYDLIYGIIAIIIGLVTIAIWIIYSGLVRLSLSLKLHTAQINAWSVSLILSIIMIIGGIYMLFQSGALVLTIGIIMLVYSIIDLIESAIFIKYVDKLL